MDNVQKLNVGNGCRIKVRTSKPLVVRHGNVVLITKYLPTAGLAA